MLESARYATPTEPDELLPLRPILSHAFGGTEDEVANWLARHDVPNVRIMRAGDRTVGCLLLIPMGQFFGGKSVPMVGVAGVAVAPEMRGRGVAKQMMRECVRELHRRGVPISCLYPATQPLYRSAGYEQAGHLMRITFNARDLVARPGVGDTGIVRPATEEDMPRIRTLYREQAMHRSGNIDRTDLMWDRIANPRGETTRCFVAEADGSILGYLYLWMDRSGGTGGGIKVTITDMVAATPHAGGLLLTFLAGHRSLGHDVVWFAGPTHPILMLLQEQWFSIARQDAWMLAVTDVERALAARGYGSAARQSLIIGVEDPVIPSNSGSFHLAIDDGAPSVRRTEAEPELRLSARGLASLYSGYLTGRELIACGLASGSDLAADKATSLFATGTPWMTDRF